MVFNYDHALCEETRDNVGSLIVYFGENGLISEFVALFKNKPISFPRFLLMNVLRFYR